MGRFSGSRAELRPDDRRRPLAPVGAATLLLSAAMVLALSSLPGHEAAAGQKPNVVVVMTDDQDVGSMRVMKSLDRFVAQRGVTFDNFFATFPLCCPSRASFLTGQYPHNHGVLSNGGPKGGADALEDSRTLPVRLDRAGYRTGFVGKYLNGFSGNGVPPGWDEWNRTAGSKMYNYGLVQDGRRVVYGSRPRDYQTDVVARKAKHIIATTPRSRPFFLTVSTLAPHGEPEVDSRRNPRPAERHRRAFERTSLPKPPSFNERDMSDKPRRIRDKPRITRRGARKLTERYQDRLASLLAVDDLVKKLVKKLRRRNELENTVIMFTSDNGFMLGEHRVKGKKRLYEESVGVPLVMSGPGIPGGETRRQVTGNIDLAPTILDLANVSGARRMDGTSLISVINDPSVASDRELLLRNARSTAIRTPDFLYADHRRNESELYDMRDDPFQLESLHNEPRYQDVKNDLEKRLRALENCRAESCRR